MPRYFVIIEGEFEFQNSILQYILYCVYIALLSLLQHNLTYISCTQPFHVVTAAHVMLGPLAISCYCHFLCA